jgi:NADH:ubiquinone oxidoreductase subunit E
MLIKKQSHNDAPGSSGKIHYLPEVALLQLAEGLKVTAQTIYGVRRFMHIFMDPKGNILCRYATEQPVMSEFHADL